MSDNPSPISRARKLRQDMTPEEKLLWANLRNRKFKGLKFLRQHPIIYEIIDNRRLFFIADFYCAEKKLVVEIDGKIHCFQKDYDERRDEILSNMELRVLRIKNEELKDVCAVLDKIGMFIKNI
jgi:very-short-patch-repair endonuclease